MKLWSPEFEFCSLPMRSNQSATFSHMTLPLIFCYLHPFRLFLLFPIFFVCLFVFSKFCLDWNLQLASFCFLVLSLPQCLHTTIWKNRQKIFKNTNLFWSLQNHNFTHTKKLYMHPDEHWQVESMVQLRHRTKLLFQGRLNEALNWCSHFR